ncbi:MAG: aminotransferase class V-fold PLP-dependent enzyme, partial [Miltoncostaeaceae bacterium]
VGARAGRAAAAAERLAELLLRVPGVRLNGPSEGRVPGYVHVAVDGVEGESLAVALSTRGVAVSPGSPCSEHAGKESPTLVAMGLTSPLTLSSVLFSGFWTTTDREVEVAGAAFAAAVERLRALSPLEG